MAASDAAPAAMKPRWSKTKILNIMCGTILFWTLFWQGLGALVHIGVDTQSVHCLPWTVFAVRQAPPAALEVGTIYVYTALNIPRVKNGDQVIKYVAAVAGDRVVVDESGIAINGHLWGPLNRDVMKVGKVSMEQIQKSYVVPTGKVLVLGSEPRSWDGRYWGLIDAGQIGGRAYPLW